MESIFNAIQDLELRVYVMRTRSELTYDVDASIQTTLYKIITSISRRARCLRCSVEIGKSVRKRIETSELLTLSLR